MLLVSWIPAPSQNNGAKKNQNPKKPLVRLIWHTENQPSKISSTWMTSSKWL